MKQKTINFRDPVVERVVDKFVGRSDVGYKKYGVTLEEDPSEILEWLNHLQEELMDAVLYLQKAKEKYEASGKHFIIETKGRANESFPMRWKLFKKYIAENKLEPFTLYKPQNQKECDMVVELILERQKKTLGSNT